MASIKDGYLKKQGARNKAWKTRYCVLTPYSLQYYKKKGDKLTGEICLYSSSKVSASIQGETFFTVASGDNETRTFHFESENEREEWIQAISKVIEEARSVEERDSRDRRKIRQRATTKILKDDQERIRRLNPDWRSSPAASEIKSTKDDSQFYKNTLSLPNVEMSTTLSFTTIFQHDFDLAIRQVAAGVSIVHVVAKQLRRVSKAEQKSAKDMMEILNHETTKMLKQTGDGMSGFFKGWLDVQKVIRTNVEKRDYVSDQLQNKVAAPLLTWAQNADNKVAQFTTTQLQLQQKINVEAMKIEKAKARALKHLDEYQHLSTSNTKAGFEKKEDPKCFEAKKKAYQTALSYDHVIKEVNEKRSHLLEKIRRLLRECQSLEEERLDLLSKHLTIYGELLKSSTTPPLRCNLDLCDLIGEMNTEADIAEYLQNCIDNPQLQLGSMDEYEYQLSVSLEDIKNGRLEQSKYSIYDCFLEGIMENQKRQIAEKNLSINLDPDLPYPLTTLLYHFELQGAATLQNLCRTARVTRKEAQDMEAKMAVGNYGTNFKLPQFRNSQVNPRTQGYLALGLLIYWLESLREPLIPFDSYQMAITAAKDGSSVKPVIDSLPDINLLVIKRLGKFFDTLLSPKARSSNKETLETILIAFHRSFIGKAPLALTINEGIDEKEEEFEVIFLKKMMAECMENINIEETNSKITPIQLKTSPLQPKRSTFKTIAASLFDSDSNESEDHSD